MYGRPIHTNECGVTARAHSILHDIETVSFTLYSSAAAGVGKIITRVYYIVSYLRFRRPIQESVGILLCFNIIWLTR